MWSWTRNRLWWTGAPVCNSQNFNWPQSYFYIFTIILQDCPDNRVSNASCQESRLNSWDTITDGSTWNIYKSQNMFLSTLFPTFPSLIRFSHCSQVWKILLPCTVVSVRDLNITFGSGSSIWIASLGNPGK